MQNGAFSFGYSFFYWPWFNQQLIDDDETLKRGKFANTAMASHTGWPRKINPVFRVKTQEEKDKEQEIERIRISDVFDIEGYRSTALYIHKSRHKDLKDEILFNDENEEIIGVEEWQDFIYNKAEKYMNTLKVKSLKYKNKSRTTWNTNYGFKRGDGITIQHLMAIILYTDTSKLSTAFTASFRKKYPTESLASVKKRNRKWWWMSKLFIEGITTFDGHYFIH